MGFKTLTPALRRGQTPAAAMPHKSQSTSCCGWGVFSTQQTRDGTKNKSHTGHHSVVKGPERNKRSMTQEEWEVHISKGVEKGYFAS